ncbi:MAG: YndJ family transporter, partial [Ilumatobacteraceae bacterium]
MFTHLTAILIAIALLVTVPLALRALGLDQSCRDGRGATATTAARWVAAASLLAPRGVVAGLLAALWLLATVGLSWRHRRAPLTHLVTVAWLPTAAAWLMADRLGIRPLGFSSHLVMLTAAHFHHAGFGVSALLSTIGARRALAVHQVGMLLVAAGLTVAHATGLDASALPGSRWLEPAGAICIVAA